MITKQYSHIRKKLIILIYNNAIYHLTIVINNIDIQWLDDRWHYFFDKQNHIPRDTRIVHAICKDFDKVWERYD